MIIGAADHISDQFYCLGNRENQSDLSDYASSTSSLVEVPKQLTNQVTYTLQQSQLRAQSSALSIQQSDKSVTLCKMVSNANVMTLCFYTYVMLIMLYAHDSVMMSVYDITENTL